MEAENVKWREARRSRTPEKKREPTFIPKFPNIPVLEDYGLATYPDEYWNTWPFSKLSDYKVSSWASPEILEEICKEAGVDTSHGLAAQVISDLKSGADIGAKGRSRLASTGPNTTEAIEHGDRVQDTLASFISMGVYTGPVKMEEVENMGVKIHPINVKVKDNGPVRVITDASYPRSKDLASEDDTIPASLNAFIDSKQFPTKMEGLPNFVEELWNQGRDARIMKADMEAAYKHIPVRVEDFPLQAIKWGDRVLFDQKLMFGTVSSAGIFDRFNMLLVILSVKLSGIEKEKVKRYLDDTFGTESKLGSKLSVFYNTYLDTCERVGVKMDKSGDPRKGQPPGTTATILGANFDTTSWTWSLSADKGAKILEAIDDILKGDACQRLEKKKNLKQRQSLVGKLIHYSYLLPESKQHMTTLFQYSETGNAKDSAFRADLTWWRTAIKRGVMGVPIPLPADSVPGCKVEVFPDAAGPSKGSISRGLGWVVLPNLWAYSCWPGWLTRESEIGPTVIQHGFKIRFTNKLSWMESLGPLWAITGLGNQCTGRTLLVWVDNIGTVGAFNKGYSTRCLFLNAVVSAAATVCKGLGTKLVVKHMPR